MHDLNGKFARAPTLRDCQPEDPKRNIIVECGNFNTLICGFLNKRPIKESEATFCLLDQRTFECDWSTVVTIAKHKQSGYKIEIFYFLPIGWLDRAISSLKDKETTLEAWYGNSDWEKIMPLSTYDRAKLFCNRFVEELNYNYAHPWPIFEKQGGGKIMYFMIHATDHPEAPKLMSRAYAEVVRNLSNEKQLSLGEDFI